MTKKINSDGVGDHCHLTGKHRGPAHNPCKNVVTQKQSKFIPFTVHNFSKYDCHPVFKKLVDKMNDKIKFKIIPKTNEEYISVKYECKKLLIALGSYQVV